MTTLEVNFYLKIGEVGDTLKNGVGLKVRSRAPCRFKGREQYVSLLATEIARAFFLSRPIIFTAAKPWETLMESRTPKE
jgi:hypothetical protein